jgi:hypothetical protein
MKVFALLWGTVASAAMSQITPPPLAAPAPMATIAPAAGGDVLRAGAEVQLKLAEDLTTQHKELRNGQRVQLQVAENVMLGGRIVIPAGSPAIGELTDVRNKGMWGKSGHINGHVLYTRVGDRQIRLSGTFNEHGTTGTAGVAVAARRSRIVARVHSTAPVSHGRALARRSASGSSAATRS